MMEHCGLFVLASAFLELNFSAGGAEGWNLLDFLLPAAAVLFVMKGLLQKQLHSLVRFSSPLPLLFLVLVVLHILTDRRFDQIYSALSHYTLPIGGFRLYYMIMINVLLYYISPMIIDSMAKLRTLLKMMLFFIFLQMALSFSRLALGIESLPWDTYTSELHALSGSEDSGTRLILLGNMGYLLFCYSLILLKPGVLRKTSLLLSGAALLISGGRAMLFGGAIVGLLYVFLERKKRSLALLGSLSMLIAVFSFSFSPSLSDPLPPLAKKYLTFLSVENHDPSPSDEVSRISLWKPQLQMILNHPVWGTLQEIPEEVDDRVKENILRGDAHSVYLGIATCFGIPALVLTGLFFLRQLRRSHLVSQEIRAGDVELFSIGRWLFYSIAGYLVMYVAIGGADGGHRSGQLLLGLVDVVAVLQSKKVHDAS